MKNFAKLSGAVDVAALQVALQLHPEMWNQHGDRRQDPTSPHRETQDIWLRYNDLAHFKGDYAAWTAQHDAVWLPPAALLPQIRPIIFSLMARFEAVRLGAVLITKIPPGKRVYAHTDTGWHPEYYNLKVYVPLAANDKCVNRVGDERVVMHVGDAWYFDNTKDHDVVNDGYSERITLIICFRVDR